MKTKTKQKHKPSIAAQLRAAFLRGATRERDDINKHLQRMIRRAKKRPEWTPQLALLQHATFIAGRAYRTSLKKGGVGRK